MSQSCDSDVVSLKSDDDCGENDPENVPLIQRRRQLLSSLLRKQDSTPESEIESRAYDIVVKNAYECTNNQEYVLLPLNLSVKEEIDQPLDNQILGSHVSCEVEFHFRVPGGNVSAETASQFSHDIDLLGDGNDKGVQENERVPSDDVVKLEIVSDGVHTFEHAGGNVSAEAASQFSHDMGLLRDGNESNDEGVQTNGCIHSDDVAKLEIVNDGFHTFEHADENVLAEAANQFLHGMGLLRDGNDEGVQANTCIHSDDVAELEIVNDDSYSSAGLDVPAITVKNDSLRDSTGGELDHIVLKKRQKILLRRKLVDKLISECKENSEDFYFSSPLHQMVQGDTGPVAKRMKVGVQSVDEESPVSHNQFTKISARNYGHGLTAETYHSNQYLLEPGRSLVTNATEPRNNMEKNLKTCSPKTMPANFNSRKEHVPNKSTNCMQTSTLPTSIQVKKELLDYYDALHNGDWKASTGSSFEPLKMKSELEVQNELNDDDIDHMQLLARMKLLPSGNESQSYNSDSFEYLAKVMPPANEANPDNLMYDKPKLASRPRKRKKTVTDSIETAMEEDAPGLLKVLVDQGVSVDEIKLYGESENHEALDDSSSDSFSELEAIMSKLFFQRTSFLKFAPIGCTNSSKPTYSVACLFSLVEQARYVQFRKWPVEWGWCRDLQSFIFVFKRHNRLVLERPEYGYATYFFELVDSLPIDWQIKRLVIAMKLSNCGRVSLIENKSLLVGKDLTEGEAKVLMEYGWTPNTGIGTMLNYCDRVVHNRRNETDTSEWRSKIGKCLIDGYRGGTIISSSVLKKIIDSQDADISRIKVECE